MHLRVSVVGSETWRASEVQEFDHEQKIEYNQITFTSNEEKEKINYLNYPPPTIDESSSNMSCKLFLA